MDSACAFLAGASLGAGLTYMLDPQQGRHRRALIRDKALRLAHDAQDAAEVVAKDARNRAQGLASGDLSVLVGGKRALEHPLRGGWSPTARALMGLTGGGLFLYGLTQEAPEACLLGAVGLALAAEGATNAGLDDIAGAPRQVATRAGEMARRATDAAAHATEHLGFDREDTGGGDSGTDTIAAESVSATRG
jgi:hypothetical protein